MSAEKISVVSSSVNSIVTVIVAPYGVLSSHRAGSHSGFVKRPLSVDTKRSFSHLMYCDMKLELDLFVNLASFGVACANNRVTTCVENCQCIG